MARASPGAGPSPARHAGEFRGVPATGRTVTATGIVILTIADGRIAEWWGNWDALGVLDQIAANGG